MNRDELLTLLNERMTEMFLLVNTGRANEAIQILETLADEILEAN